jgi:hypothetical protein
MFRPFRGQVSHGVGCVAVYLVENFRPGAEDSAIRLEHCLIVEPRGFERDVPPVRELHRRVGRRLAGGELPCSLHPFQVCFRLLFYQANCLVDILVAFGVSNDGQ